MVILTVEGLSKGYGVKPLFEDVSFGISDTDRVGLIGANGAGKSTLIRLLSGKERPDQGVISLNREARLEVLSQQPAFDSHDSAMDFMLSGDPEPLRVARAYREAALALDADPYDESALARVAEHGQSMDRVDGWMIESVASRLLDRLGIHDPLVKLNALSGGQQKRVALARALLVPCDLLVLDEPTNHLDIATVAWLEEHLQTRQGALLLITHDRYFLERVTNVTFELAEQTLFRHEGNYAAFLESRASRWAHQARREHRRSQLAKKELEWLRRGPKARTTKSRARTERAQALQVSQESAQPQQVEVDLLTQRLGKKVVELSHITIERGGRRLLDDFSYTFAPGERVGLIGPNGVGKSTLLDILTGKLQPDSGDVDTGQTVAFGYYDQHATLLDMDARVHDYITRLSNDIQTSQGSLSASQMLERFLFSPEKQWSPIGRLSGGERRRLFLLRVLMTQPNVLILDEPTNDLDLDTLNVLEDYLDQYGGVLIVVSHDRYFLDRTVEHLLVFDAEQGLVEFPGTYSAWEAQRQEDDAARRVEANAQAKRATTQAKGAATGAPAVVVAAAPVAAPVAAQPPARKRRS